MGRERGKIKGWRSVDLVHINCIMAREVHCCWLCCASFQGGSGYSQRGGSPKVPEGHSRGYEDKAFPWFIYWHSKCISMDDPKIAGQITSILASRQQSRHVDRAV